jgi:hypothetical protein
MPICTNCKQNKALKEFHKDSRAVAGHRSHCKACVKSYYKYMPVVKKEDLIDYGSIGLPDVPAVHAGLQDKFCRGKL